MKKIDIEKLKNTSFEDGKTALERAGYYLSDSATDVDAPGCDYIEDTYFVLLDEDENEIDSISFSRWMKRNNEASNDDRSSDFVVKEGWGRV